MNLKQIVIIIVIAIIVFFIGFGVTYMFLINDDVNEKIECVEDTEDVNNDIEIEEDESEEIQEEEEYTILKTTSSLANSIYSIIPTYYPSMSINYLNDYMIYTSLINLSSKEPTTDYLIDDVFYGYKEDDVLKEAQIIYGNDIELEFKEAEDYELQITTDTENSLLAILPYSVQGSEEYLSLKEVYEYEDRYEVYTYLIMIEYVYDSEALTTMYVGNNDSYMSEIVNKTTTDKNLSEMNIYQPENDMVSVEDLVEEYSEELPVLKYTILKDDSNENEMYIEKIEYNY